MRVIFISMLVLVFFASCTNDKIKISSQGSTKYKIHLDDFESKDVLESGEILNNYINKVSGLKLEFAKDVSPEKNLIILRNNDEAKHVSYFKEGNNLIIESSVNLKDAVYTFLENELGVRYYSPDFEFVPKMETIELDIQAFSYTPDISTRTVHSRLFYEDSVFADKQKVTDSAFPYYVPISRVHTFHRFISPDKFMATHPEYFAERNERRLGTQLCLTNEAVYQIVRDSVDAQLDRYPEAEVISVSTNDNTQYCQCVNCAAIDEKEGSPAGSLLQFVNRIAREFPTKQISTLAYQYTRKAPKNIKPEKNVLITLCSIECDRSASIEDKCKGFKDDLLAWGKISDNVRIWDYTTQFTNFLAPFPNLHTLSPNIKLFRDNSAKWIFEQHSRNPSELFELRSYLTAKLLWNPDADPNEIMDEFLTGYYGSAAPFIKQYIDEVHEGIQRDSSFFLFLYGDPSQAFSSFLSSERLIQYDQYFDQAEEAIGESAELLSHVRRARLSIDYAILEYGRRDFTASINNLSLEDRLARFISTTTEGNITAMNEMRYSVSEYIDQYRKSLKRGSKDNLAAGKKVALLTKPKKYANENPQALTDGILGGASFYSNWLGFEGNHLEANIELEEEMSIQRIESTFLQTTNHIVFFPLKVEYYSSMDGVNYSLFGEVENQFPLSPKSTINQTQAFVSERTTVKAKYIKIKAVNMNQAPAWHNSAGLPVWIFIDEVIIE